MVQLARTREPRQGFGLKQDPGPLCLFRRVEGVARNDEKQPQDLPDRLAFQNEASCFAYVRFSVQPSNRM